MYLTWLDSNSWLIEIGEQRILLDPWLVGSLTFGGMDWLFKGDRTTPRSIPDAIDLILLSQGLEDHAHPPTLKALDRHIPVVASPSAAKVVRELGYEKITAIAHDESFILADRVKIQAVPGSPIGPLTVENGYLLHDLKTGESLYYEPHGYHTTRLKEFAPVDVVITPVIDLTIPFLGAIIKGKNSAFEVANWLRPHYLLPTAAGGEITFEGVLNSILKAIGSAEELRDRLADNQMSTQVIEPKPGDRLELITAQRATLNS